MLRAAIAEARAFESWHDYQEALKHAIAPGHVLLEKGEGNLPKQSVVLVSQIFTVDKSQLGEFIGTLSEDRVKQILEGVRLMTEIRNLE